MARTIAQYRRRLGLSGPILSLALTLTRDAPVVGREMDAPVPGRDIDLEDGRDCEGEVRGEAALSSICSRYWSCGALSSQSTCT